MSHILLVGAGFSRNWGGWLASEVFNALLAFPDIQGDQYLRNLLWSNQHTGGFENALADVQRAYLQDAAAPGHDLQVLQHAVLYVFQGMSNAYLEIRGIEFQQHINRMLRTFLVRFDAIFTLNQDVLLDHHYLNANLGLTAPQRWPNGGQLPGMRRIPNQQHAFPAPSWGRDAWVPLQPAEFLIRPLAQPFFKLHGSTNWRDTQGGQMLVIGGDKSQAIQSHQVLTWYFERFEDYLNRPNTKLMVIGYGFRDPHINRPIIDAISNSGLRFFVINSLGANVVKYANPSFGGAIYAPNELDDAFHAGLTGASQRNLLDTFGNDAVSHDQVMGFFAN